MIKQSEIEKSVRHSDTLSFTGKGTVIGIVSQHTWLDHPAYKRNLMYDIKIKTPLPAGQSAPAQTPVGAEALSVAVGDLGVARNAKVVYCAVDKEPPYKQSPSIRDEEWTRIKRDYVLDSVARGLEFFKKYVENGNALDVISVPAGWSRAEPEAARVVELADWFEARSIPVYSLNDFELFSARTFIPCGPGGPPGFASAEQPGFDYTKREYKSRVGIPIDRRELALVSEAHAPSEGRRFRKAVGDKELAPSIVAGMFALAREANPAIGREAFELLVKKTARTVALDERRTMRLPDLKALEGALMPGRPAVQHAVRVPVYCL